MRTSECGPGVRAGRLAKARQFAAAADDVLALADESDDVADAFVTLAVHAGIAAADVLCCARLGYFSRSERHDEAVALLRQADANSAKALDVLLRLKTAAGYSYVPITTKDRLRAERAMHALLDAANSV